MSDLTALDIIIILIIGISTFMSLVRGFTREVLSLASWVAAAYSALFIGPLLTPIVSQYVTIIWLSTSLAFGGIFLATLIVCSILANKFSNRLQNSSVGALDRTLGVIFGGLRGGLIVSLAYLLLLIILPRNEQPSWLTEARLYPLVQTGSAIILSIIPETGLNIDTDKLNNVIDLAPADTLPTLLKEQTGIVTDLISAADSDKDTKSNKGYSDADRAVLDSLIKGTQKVE